MPDELPTPGQRRGLVIYFNGITKESTPWEILKRIQVIETCVLQKAYRQSDGAFGVKLRRTARIVLVIDAAERKEKVIATVRRRDTTLPGVLTCRVFSRDEAWERTYVETCKIFNALKRYARFAHQCFLAAEDPYTAPPAQHPSVYFARFVRPVFGTYYKELHKELLARNRQVPLLGEKKDSGHMILSPRGLEMELEDTAEEDTATSDKRRKK